MCSDTKCQLNCYCSTFTILAMTWHSLSTKYRLRIPQFKRKLRSAHVIAVNYNSPSLFMGMREYLGKCLLSTPHYIRGQNEYFCDHSNEILAGNWIMSTVFGESAFEFNNIYLYGNNVMDFSWSRDASERYVMQCSVGISQLMAFRLQRIYYPHLNFTLIL